MKRFKNILLYAGMEENEVALARALKLASENQATLTIMDVVKPIPHALGLFTDVASSEELQELVVKDHHEKLQEIADSHKDKGVEISVAVSKGDPATEIVKKVIRILAAFYDLFQNLLFRKLVGHVSLSILNPFFREARSSLRPSSF